VSSPRYIARAVVRGVPETAGSERLARCAGLQYQWEALPGWIAELLTFPCGTLVLLNGVVGETTRILLGLIDVHRRRIHPGHVAEIARHCL
jgi:hypothetical protein